MVELIRTLHSRTWQYSVAGGQPGQTDKAAAVFQPDTKEYKIQKVRQPVSSSPESPQMRRILSSSPV